MPQSVCLAPGPTAPLSLPSSPVTFPIHPSYFHSCFLRHSFYHNTFLSSLLLVHCIPAALCLDRPLKIVFPFSVFSSPVFLILLSLPALVSFQIHFLSSFLSCVITCSALMCCTCVFLSTLSCCLCLPLLCQIFFAFVSLVQPYFNVPCLRTLPTFWPFF